MKTKILMLVGVAVSVIFLSTSAFAVLTLATEKNNYDHYIEVVIKAQNDGSESYPQVGIQTIRKSIDLDSEISVHTSVIEDYDELGNPVLMLDKEGLLDREGNPLFSRTTRIEMRAPVDDHDRDIMTINGLKHIYAPEVPEVVEKRIFFINEYNLQGVKVCWFEGILKPDAEVPEALREMSPRGAHKWDPLDPDETEEPTEPPIKEYPFSRKTLCDLSGEDEVRHEERPFYYPSEPLYKLYAVGGGGTVELGSIFVPKPEGSETLPVFVYDIYITGGEAAPLIDFEVDPNVP